MMKTAIKRQSITRAGVIVLTLLLITLASVQATFADQADYKVAYNDEMINYDVETQVIDGVTMVPLKLTLDQLEFEVNWEAQSRQVTLLRGAQYTAITIGENSYFKNKMAPIELSHSPIIVEGRTLVPLEFFTDILDIGIQVKDNKIMFNDDSNGHESGIVQSIENKEDGAVVYTIGPSLEETDMGVITILTTYPDQTIMQKTVEVGDRIHAVTPLYRIMIIPAQTSASLIY